MGYNRNMKTTIDITDGLVEEAKGLAAARGITFREVVETGLRRVLEAIQTAKSQLRQRWARARSHLG